MHPAARSYVARTLGETPYRRVVEIGGRNINGGVRDLIPHEEWLSVDLEPGVDVDVVGDCREWRPPWPADLVICLEVLEHAPDPDGIVVAAIGYLARSGRLLLTCAGPGRPEHSGQDGMPQLQPGEHYANIDPNRLRSILQAALVDVEVVYDETDHDVRATGVR